MEFQTPGVYVREVDSGSKPIASVPTSIPGFLGLFNHTPATDAVAINATGNGGAITGKVLPQLVDASGAAKEADAGAARFRRVRAGTARFRRAAAGAVRSRRARAGAVRVRTWRGRRGRSTRVRAWGLGAGAVGRLGLGLDSGWSAAVLRR